MAFLNRDSKSTKRMAILREDSGMQGSGVDGFFDDQRG